MLTVIFTENRKPEEWNYKTKVLNTKPQRHYCYESDADKYVDVHKNVIV